MKKLPELNINGAVAKVPIIQGGMGIGISLSSLAGAVAAEGGVGVISAAVPGFYREDFAADPLRANVAALSEHIRAAKKQANGGLVGVNIMHALNNFAELVKCSAENGADIVICGAGLPTSLPALIAGSSTKIAPIVSSKKAAAVLLKLWDKKFAATADMVVIEGPKAGGHLGFSPAELETEIGYDAEIKLILQEVSQYEEKYARKIPIIFAGGVHTRGDIEHYLSLGCAGVQIATRFIATEECDAHPAYKAEFLKHESTFIIQSPVGMPGRALKTPFMKRISAAPVPPKNCTKCITHCNPATTPYCISRALIAAAKGDLENGLFFCGANVEKITEITTVKKIFEELTG